MSKPIKTTNNMYYYSRCHFEKASLSFHLLDSLLPLALNLAWHTDHIDSLTPCWEWQRLSLLPSHNERSWYCWLFEPAAILGIRLWAVHSSLPEIRSNSQKFGNQSIGGELMFLSGNGWNPLLFSLSDRHNSGTSVSLLPQRKDPNFLEFRLYSRGWRGNFI